MGCMMQFWNRVRYLISKKSGITVSINHNFAWIRVDLYDSSLIEKILIFHNVITLIKSAVIKNENSDHDNTFLEKCSYKDKANTGYFWMNFWTESKFLKQLMLIKKVHQKRMIFFTIGIF